jgi:acetyl esterase
MIARTPLRRHASLTRDCGTAPALWLCGETICKGRNPAAGYAVPARAAELGGLPPTYLMVAGLDPSRDEALRFAERLLADCGSLEMHLVPGVPHMFDVLAPGIEVTRRAVAGWTSALAAGLGVPEKVGVVC